MAKYILCVCVCVYSFLCLWFSICMCVSLYILYVCFYVYLSDFAFFLSAPWLFTPVVNEPKEEIDCSWKGAKSKSQTLPKLSREKNMFSVHTNSPCQMVCHQPRSSGRLRALWLRLHRRVLWAPHGLTLSSKVVHGANTLSGHFRSSHHVVVRPHFLSSPTRGC